MNTQRMVERQTEAALKTWPPVVLHRLVGRSLCRVGLHKWRDVNAPTLRCVRCKKIVSRWASKVPDITANEKVEDPK